MANLVGSNQLHHIHEVQELKASADVQAASIISKGSLFFGDMRLVHIGGLRMLIKKDKVPETFVRQGIMTAERFRTCADWLVWAQQNEYEFHIDAVFPLHFLEDDFDEIPIGNHSWNSLIVKLQQDVAALQASDAQDQAETLAAITAQLQASGLIDQHVDSVIHDHAVDTSNLVTKQPTTATTQTINSGLKTTGDFEAPKVITEHLYAAPTGQTKVGDSTHKFYESYIQVGHFDTIAAVQSTVDTSATCDHLKAKTATSKIGEDTGKFQEAHITTVKCVDLEVSQDGSVLGDMEMGTAHVNKIERKDGAASWIGTETEPYMVVRTNQIEQIQNLVSKDGVGEGNIGAHANPFAHSWTVSAQARNVLPNKFGATVAEIGSAANAWNDIHTDMLHVYKEAFAPSVKFTKTSVWFGEDIHMGNLDGRTFLHERKKIIPKFQADAGVVEADYVAAGTTSSAATLAKIQEVSTAKSLTTDLSLLFPPANYADDFSEDTTFDKIVLKSSDKKPTLLLRGNDAKIAFRTTEADGDALLAILRHDESGEFLQNVRTESSQQVQSAEVFKWNASGIELAAGKTLKYAGGSDVQTQLTAQDTRVIALEATYDDAAVDSKIAAEIAALQNGAPATLDTLKEISDSLAADVNLSVTLTGLIGQKVAQTAYDAKVLTQDAAIALNTTKVTYDAQAAVALNTAKYASSAVDTLLAAKAPAASPVLTGTVELSHIKSDGAHLKLEATTPDINLCCSSVETLQVTRSGTECRLTASGGSGVLRVMGALAGNGIVTFANLPTSDPGVAGQLWNSSGDLKIST